MSLETERTLPREIKAAAGRPSVEVVDDVVRFASLRAEWDELVDASDASVFNSWEWLFPWFRRIGPRRRLRILTARDGAGRLLGIAPLSIERHRVLGRAVRRLRFLGDAGIGSDYLDLVARRDHREAVTRAFARAVLEDRESWDLVDLIDLDEGSPTVAVFREVFAIGPYDISQTDRFVCPRERFRPEESFQEFLRRTRRRENYLRRKSWLERQAGYRIETTEDPTRLPEAFDELLRLHRLRWDPEGGSQGIRGPRIEAFHRDATALLAERGRLRLYTMKVGRQAVASAYAIVDHGAFLYYQSGYDPRWRDRSVGLVLVGQTFKDSFDLGLREYDFLRGNEGYKYDWVTGEHRTVALRIQPRDGPGPWIGREERAVRSLRTWAKRILPRTTVQAIRLRLRRRAAR